MPLSKCETIVRELTAGIASGELGRSGDRFLTTRELGEKYGVALKTAFQAMRRLRDDGIIERCGRAYRIAPLLPGAGAGGGAPPSAGGAVTAVTPVEADSSSAGGSAFSPSVGAGFSSAGGAAFSPPTMVTAVSNASSGEPDRS